MGYIKERDTFLLEQCYQKAKEIILENWMDEEVTVENLRKLYSHGTSFDIVFVILLNPPETSRDYVSVEDSVYPVTWQTYRELKPIIKSLSYFGSESFSLVYRDKQQQPLSSADRKTVVAVKLEFTNIPGVTELIFTLQTLLNKKLIVLNDLHKAYINAKSKQHGTDPWPINQTLIDSMQKELHMDRSLKQHELSDLYDF